jgi:hypothetical protein
MSLKVIQLSDTPAGPLTVDSTLITVDSTIITADQTVYYTINTTEHVLSIIPRFYETEVKLILWNEIKEVQTNLTITATITNGYLEIPFTLYLEEGDSLEVKVTNMADKLMWRGKIYATSQTDLENFTLNPKTTNNIIKI